jgi:hypothetical protein
MNPQAGSKFRAAPAHSGKIARGSQPAHEVLATPKFIETLVECGQMGTASTFASKILLIPSPAPMRNWLAVPISPHRASDDRACGIR